MRKNIRINLMPFLFTLCFAFNPVLFLHAQEIPKAVSDTTKKPPETIPLSDISVRSVDVVINTKKMAESLITDEKITILGKTIDSLLGIVDSLLKTGSSIDLQSSSIRVLNTKQVFWNVVQARINNEKSKYSGFVKTLDEKKYRLEHESTIWKNTKGVVQKENEESAVLSRINNLIFYLDSAAAVIQGKSEKVLKVLDKITSRGLAVNDRIKEIGSIIDKKTGEIFVANQAPIWNTAFTSAAKRDIIEPMRQFYRMEIKELIPYFKMYRLNTIFQLSLLIFLIASFLMIKRRIRKTAINDTSLYQRMLVSVLSHPVSAALILGLFASVLIFPNRPLIFRDIIRLAGTIPLIIIVITLTPKKYNKYFYIVGILMFIQMVYFIYPPGHFLYLSGLLILALIEIVTLVFLLRHFQKYPLAHRSGNNLVIFFIYIFLGFTFTGLISVITGATLLAEITLDVLIMSAFAGILLVISSVIINGLVEVAIESRSLQKLNVFRLYGGYIEARITRLINLGAFIFFLFSMLKVINIDRYVVEGITAIFTYNISFGSVSFSLGGIVTFFLVIWLSIVIAKMIKIILEKDVLNNLNLSKGVPHTIAVMINYTLVTLGLMLAIGAAGMPLDRMTILFGAFGVGIGFGLQNIFNNLVSGLILLFERPIQIGDTIEVGQLIGNVKSIGIRASNIRTFDGAEVIVPNGQLISNEVVNWTLSDQTRRIEIIAGVAYGSDPHKVKELFEKVLTAHPDVILEPPPKVLFNDLGESSLDFRLLFWTSNFDEWIRIRSEIIFGIHDILKAEGIQIPFPQRDLHLRSVDKGIEFVRKESKD